MNASKILPLLLLSILLTFLTGCGDLTGRGPAPLDRTLDVAQRDHHTRVGYVYCMRGFLGIFSEGMDQLADKIDTQLGVPAVSVANEERDRLKDWIVDNYRKGAFRDGPLVLLGHSYGADDMIRVAEHLKEDHITVDLLVLIDPVTPPPVPDNVKKVYCVYKSNPLTDWYPAWRGVAASVQNPQVTELTNIDIRVTNVGFDTSNVVHPTIDKVPGIHDLAIEQIRETCPTRTAWAEMQKNRPTANELNGKSTAGIQTGTAINAKPGTP